MTSDTTNLTRFIIDTSLYAPRHNPGDELFLRRFSMISTAIRPGTEVVIRTREGRMIIGNLYNVGARGISVIQPHQEIATFISFKRVPILFEITAATRTKARCAPGCRCKAA